jgi:cytochrome c-type biogenesis protein CcmH/NrfG
VQSAELKPRASAPRPPSPAPRASPKPAPPPRQLSAPLDNDWDAPVVRRSSGAGWIFFLVVAAMVGGGVGYYFAIYLPDQERLAEERAEDPERQAEEQAAAEAEAKAKADTEEKARLEKEALAAAQAPQPDAGAVAAVVAPPAPVLAPVDAGSPDAGSKPIAPPVKRDFEWYVAQGDRLRDREKASQALEMYGQAADLEPERVEPAAGRGLALLDMGKTLQAEAAFQEAIKLNSRYAPAIMGLAETYRALKKNEQAIEMYKKYLDVLPNGPESNVARSNIERLKPKTEEPAPE